MKNQVLILLSFLTINVYAQIDFEKGYFINNENQKTDCLIKNIDWKNNPTKFDYKLNENAAKETVTIKTVQEFGIHNVSKYVRADVKIDRSSEAILNLSKERKPIFEADTLFLKILIEGKASLYRYYEGNLERYFYNKDNSKIEQLVFKSYKNSKNTIAKNIQYQQQLINNLKCSSFSDEKAIRLKYEKKDLTRFFVAYNECQKESFTNFETKQKRDLFNLNLRPGWNRSTLSVENSLSSSRNVDFGDQLTFRFGIEAELIIPFNKNKWSVIIEPTYQYFNATQEVDTRTINTAYQSVELPIGIRHYFFLGENSKIFVNASYVFDISRNSSIDLDFGTSLEIASLNNLALGLGYKQNDRFSLEFRYLTPRDVLGRYVSWTSDYTTLSVVLGYTLF